MLATLGVLGLTLLLIVARAFARLGGRGGGARPSRALSTSAPPPLSKPFSLSPSFSNNTHARTVWTAALALAGVDILPLFLAALRPGGAAAAAAADAAADARRAEAAAEVRRLRAVAGRVAADGQRGAVGEAGGGDDKEEEEEEEEEEAAGGARRRRCG